MSRCAFQASLAVACMMVSGCISVDDTRSQSDQVIPSLLLEHVDRSFSFTQLQANPVAYQGRMIVLGGEVLKVQRLRDQTRIEVMQLPLNEALMPTLNRPASQGRFFAYQTKLLEPGELPRGTPITIVGEMTGSTTELLDSVQYPYPTIAVKHLKIWMNESILPDRPRDDLHQGLSPWVEPLADLYGAVYSDLSYYYPYVSIPFHFPLRRESAVRSPGAVFEPRLRSPTESVVSRPRTMFKFLNH